MNHFHSRRKMLLALSAASVLLVTGCVVAPPQAHIERAAHNVVQAPPAPIAEAIPPAPYPDAYWITGHWKWEGNRYVWNGGHWEQARPNMVFQHAYWANERGEWVLHPGHWVQVDPGYRVETEVITIAPPPPRVEVQPPPPGPNQVWIGGYWRWNHGRHEWVGGHWDVRRDGYFWAPGHWYRNGAGWTFSGGFWQRY